MKLRCNNCEYNWDYKGESKFYATCPRCLRKVKIEENKIKTKLQKGIIKEIRNILKKNDVVKAGIFGSFARGEANRKSDIDILIKFKGRKSLIDLARVEIELEKKLNRKVELITYNSIHPMLKKMILREEIIIL